MNKWFNPGQNKVTKPGCKATAIVKPVEKVMLVQESPDSMKESAFTPGTGSSANKVQHVTHNGKVNITMCDGHVEQVKDAKLKEMITTYANRYFDPLKYN
jgi:prepilin-type processing-associated H-X9-DG protein